MSIEVMTRARRRIIGEGATDKAIFLYLADLASDDGSGIWASKTTIAADVQTTDRTVRRAIARFIEAGLIREDGQKPKTGGGFTVIYAIDLRALAALPSTRQKRADIRSGRTSGPGAGGSGVLSRADTVSGKPLEEPSVEPPIVARSQGDQADPADLLGDPIPKKKEKPKAKRFEDWWADHYPHRGAKQNKKACKEKYQRLVASGVSEDDLIRGADRYRVLCQKTQKPARMPMTWLNQEGWLDEIEGQGQAAPISEANRLLQIADRIKSGKAFLCTNISATAAREAIKRDLVSEAQCRAVGIYV